MRYHHRDGDCHGYGYYGGWHDCGDGYRYGAARSCGPDLPFDEPRTYGFARGRRLGYSASRATGPQRLEVYLESLRDEMRVVEEDLRDLRGEGGEPAGPTI